MTRQEQLYNMTMATGVQVRDPERLTGLEEQMLRVWGCGDRQWQPGLCQACGQSLPDGWRGEIDVGGAPLQIDVTICDRCKPLVDRHYASDGRRPDIPWDTECPPLFRRMILGDLRPHYVDSAAAEQIIDWTPERGAGIIAVGPSGTGKTLACWTCKRNLELSGYRCDFYSAVEIARELSRHAKDLDTALHLWRTKVLIIDDLGKERVTPAACALLWELIDRRYTACVHTLITTRFRSEKFIDRFGDADLGGDIYRRIKDTTTPVRFRSREAAAV